jgi:hypothetical protein
MAKEAQGRLGKQLWKAKAPNIKSELTVLTNFFLLKLSIHPNFSLIFQLR